MGRRVVGDHSSQGRVGQKGLPATKTTSLVLDCASGDLLLASSLRTALCFSWQTSSVRCHTVGSMSKSSLHSSMYLLLAGELSSDLDGLLHESLQHLLSGRGLVEVCDCLEKSAEVPRLTSACQQLETFNT